MPSGVSNFFLNLHDVSIATSILRVPVYALGYRTSPAQESVLGLFDCLTAFASQEILRNFAQANRLTFLLENVPVIGVRGSIDIRVSLNLNLSD